MRLPFRQGIVTAPTGFLVAQSGSVNLVVNPTTPIVLTFADKDANYTVTERVGVNAAWSGPFTPSTNYWLYWDINIKTGALTRGSTTLAPSIGATAPASPINGQYWFDTTNTVGYVWRASGSRWVRVIRVIAARYNGSFSSVSISSPLFTGTQVGNQTTNLTGYIVFDTFGLPTKRSNDTFFTTETTAIAGVTNSSELKLAATILEAEAQETAVAYSIVKLSDFSKFIVAAEYEVGSTVYGIIDQDVTTGQYTTIYTQGVVENQAWSWTTVGAPLYVDSSGLLTDVPVGQTQIIAYALTPTSVFFNPAITGLSSVGGSSLIGITGSNTTALGVGALTSLTNGTSNTVVGFNAGTSITTGDENVAVGPSALSSVVGTDLNVAIGSESLQDLTTGAYNVAVGARSGANIISGTGNALLGYNVGSTLTLGSSGNVMIGNEVGPSSPGAISNQLYIHNTFSNNPLIHGDFSTRQLTINGQFIGADGTTPTKKYTFDASGIAPSTTRTYLMPNQNGTLALLSDITGGSDQFQLTVTNPYPGSVLTKGMVVLLSYSGSALEAYPYESSNIRDGYQGWVLTQDIQPLGTGLAIRSGLLSGVDTSAYGVNDVLYLSEITPGGFTTSPSNKPMFNIGTVITVSATTGSILLTLQGSMGSLESLADVDQSIGAADGDYLRYNGGTELWNASPLTLPANLTTSSNTSIDWQWNANISPTQYVEVQQYSDATLTTFTYNANAYNGITNANYNVQLDPANDSATTFVGITRPSTGAYNGVLSSASLTTASIGASAGNSSFAVSAKLTADKTNNLAGIVFDDPEGTGAFLLNVPNAFGTEAINFTPSTGPEPGLQIVSWLKFASGPGGVFFYIPVFGQPT